MQRVSPQLFAVVLASACGPLVPLEADTDAADTGSSAGPADDDDDGAPVDSGGVDGVPPSGEVGDEVGDEGEVDTGSTGTCDEPDCTSTPGLMLWSQTVDGEGNNDSAGAVAISTTGEVLVAGAVRIAGGDDAWLRVFAPDGATVREHVVDFTSDEFATGIAIAPDGTAFVTGLQPWDDRALLLRLDETDLVSVDGAPTDIVPFTALASPTAEGFVVVTNAGGFDDITATVRRFDSAGVVIGDVVQPADVFIGAAIRSVDGGTILGGGSFSPMGNGSTPWLAALAVDGGAQWSWMGDEEPDWEVRLRGLAVAPDGRIVGVGTRGLDGQNGNDQGWSWWWSADGQLESEGPLDIGGAAARPYAVVVGAHGIIVGGTTVDIDNGFVAGFATDGTLEWGFELAGDLDLEDGVAALAVDPRVGIVAVGWVTQSTTNQDAWVGVFSD
jgi:hypothetical protein